MRSLVLGRFQPLHLGHLKMIEHAAQKSTFLTIGVGSCNSSMTPENPFSAQEREEMIKESVRLQIPYEIKRIPDFGDNAQWARWIIENVRFDAFMTNSPNERRIFEHEGVKVQEMPFFDRGAYSATEVRRRLIEGGDWASLLPLGTVKVMSRIDGEYRIRRLGKA